jgi:hypothetical protein
MSIPAIEAVRAYISADGPGATLSTGQKLVLSDLAQVGDDHGVSFLSITGQAKQLGMARSSVQAAREALIGDDDNPGPLRVAERVPGRAPMLWINLPGLDGNTAESWGRRRVGRNAAVPVTGTPSPSDWNPSGSAVPVDERPGVPVPGGGVPVDEKGGVPVDGDRPVSRPMKDPLIDPLAENGSNHPPQNYSSRNGNGQRPLVAVVNSGQAAQATRPNEQQQRQVEQREELEDLEKELKNWRDAVPSMHSKPQQRKQAKRKIPELERRIAELKAEEKAA